MLGPSMIMVGAPAALVCSLVALRSVGGGLAVSATVLSALEILILGFVFAMAIRS